MATAHISSGWTQPNESRHPLPSPEEHRALCRRDRLLPSGPQHRGENLMDIETLKRQQREATRDAEDWAKRAEEARQDAKRFEQYAATRRRDAAGYYALAVREQEEIDREFNEIVRAA